MHITIADRKSEIADGTTVAQLLEIEKVEMPLYVTVSVNDEFIATDARETTVLKDGDHVEFLYFMGGGCR
ncbi:MAG: sulfur carrier protein ThiS [Kiritimatiellae bacterium]|nr:sulfur carrier protein ThiS [Kiritimatiellia bacterium]